MQSDINRQNASGYLKTIPIFYFQCRSLLAWLPSLVPYWPPLLLRRHKKVEGGQLFGARILCWTFQCGPHNGSYSCIRIFPECHMRALTWMVPFGTWLLWSWWVIFRLYPQVKPCSALIQWCRPSDCLRWNLSMGGGGGGEYSTNIWIQVSRWGFETLTLCRTKKNPKIHTLFGITPSVLLPC